jgi:replication factor C large subunit
MWIDENLPREFTEPGERAEAFSALSRADVFLGRVRRRNEYGLWSYASELLSGGVASARRSRGGAYVAYQFPGWIRQMGSSKGMRALRDATAEKLGHRLHSSRRIVLRDVLPALRFLALQQRPLAERVGLDFDLSGDELAFLLGPDAPEAYVKDVLEHVERRRAEGATSAEAFLGEAQDDEPQEQEPIEDAAPAPSGGKTLFDF